MLGIPSDLFPPYENAGYGSCSVNCRWCGKLINDGDAIPVAYTPDRVKVAKELMEVAGPLLVCDECWDGVCGEYDTKEILGLLKALSKHCRRMEAGLAQLHKTTEVLREVNDTLCSLKDTLGNLDRGTI